MSIDWIVDFINSTEIISEDVYIGQLFFGLISMFGRDLCKMATNENINFLLIYPSSERRRRSLLSMIFGISFTQVLAPITGPEGYWTNLFFLYVFCISLMLFWYFLCIFCTYFFDLSSWSNHWASRLLEQS